MGLTTTKEWRWDAPGAHTLTGAAGSARILLRDFLLECGWSVIWEDAGAQKVVLRNSQAHGGSGCYVRILDDGSGTGGARNFDLQVYESMTDIDTGTAGTNPGRGMKSNALTGDPRVYTLHGDERTFYMTVYSPSDIAVDGAGTGSGAGMMVIGAGDYDPAIPGDAGVFLAGAVPNAAGTFAASSLLFSNNGTGNGTVPEYSVTRDASLNPSPTMVGCLNISRDAGGSGVVHGNSGMILGVNIATPTVVPATMLGGGKVRGRMRGLYTPADNWTTSGGAPIGSVHSPINTRRALSLAALAGNSSNSGSNAGAGGRVFVERLLSWDDV